MEWLTHNQIANMPGPEFIFFYMVAIIGVLLICRFGVRRARGVDDPILSLAPGQLDRYEVAYLRRGEAGLMEVIVFKLLQHGYLAANSPKDPKLRQADGHPEPASLSEIEQTVFHSFSRPKSVAEGLMEVKSSLQNFAAAYDAKLRRSGFFTSPEATDKMKRVRNAALAIVLGLGGYKLLIALSRGRTNVFFLVALGLAGAILVLLQCRPPRLSKSGVDHLKNLQAALRPPRGSTTGVDDPASGELDMLVAAAGIGVLAGTAFGAFVPMFGSQWVAQAGTGDSSWSGGDFSSGDSSSSSGGCSDGGGGGGCSGGGGCGGCSS